MELNGDCQKYSQSYDVVLKVGNKTFYLEKETLREKCAYFEAMFSGKFAEDSQQEVAIEVRHIYSIFHCHTNLMKLELNAFSLFWAEPRT